MFQRVPDARVEFVQSLGRETFNFPPPARDQRSTGFSETGQNDPQSATAVVSGRLGAAIRPPSDPLDDGSRPLAPSGSSTKRSTTGVGRALPPKGNGLRLAGEPSLG